MADDTEEPTMRWFSHRPEGWGAPINQTCKRTDLPTTPCGMCDQPFKEFDFGVVMPFIGGPDDIQEIGYHHACLFQLLGLNPHTPPPRQPSGL